MKQSLQLRMEHGLTMTPQLQQAIRLLQLSTLELNDEIQANLESNPLLEEVENGEDDKSSPDHAEKQTENATVEDHDNAVAASDAAVDQDTCTQLEDQSMPEELASDSSWEDVFDGASFTATTSTQSQERMDGLMRDDSAEGMREHLFWQLQMTSMSPRDFEIASAIIDAIGDDGYLDVSLDEIFQDGHIQGSAEDEFGMDEIEVVLHRIQNFDPVGVGARDLKECLLLQLHHVSLDTVIKGQLEKLITSFLPQLASHDYAVVLSRMGVTREKLQELMVVLHGLNPRPGDNVSSKKTEYITPDVMVKKIKGQWQVNLNGDILPKIRINAQYAGYIRRNDKSDDNTYLKDHLQEAKWFIKSIQSRNETLLKVSRYIVNYQKNFLEYGEEAMRPLVLHDVAEAVEMHESTISRVTTRKYMHTPKGIFELKYFFSSHVKTSSGGTCSSVAIKALIKKLIAEESDKKPLSDSKIAIIMSQQGINVARRTIAKYRELMRIPPSNERKKLL